MESPVYVGSYFEVYDESVLGKKTHRWLVVTRTEKELLGRIAWHSAWRCYAFEPDTETIYEATCLSELAEFLKSQTDLIRATWKSSA